MRQRPTALSTYRNTRWGLMCALSLLAPLPTLPAFAASWQPTGAMALPRALPTATLLGDGSVLVTGGNGIVDEVMVQLFTAERFDPKTSAFVVAGRLNEGRAGHAAVRLRDGRVLIAGGYGGHNGMQTLASAELFDPSTNTFKAIEPLTEPREFPTGTLLPDGRVLIVGGYNNQAQTQIATAELFDPATGKFTKTGSLAAPRNFHRAVSLPDGRIAIVGGWGLQAVVNPSVEIYDPASGTFTTNGKLTTGRILQATSLLADGKILVAGGWMLDTDRPGAVTSAEVYDTATGRSTEIGKLSAARFTEFSAPLADGRVMIGGGRTAIGSEMLGSTEVVDPRTGAITPGEPLGTPRSDPAALTLPDGRVLVIGGVSKDWPNPTFLSSAEIYTP